MAKEELTIVFKHGTLGAEFALREIQAELAEQRIPLGGFQSYDEPVDLPTLLAHLKNAKRKTFNLAGQGFVFDLGSVQNFHLDFLEIKSTGERQGLWEKWASRFVGNPNFVMAWLADTEYQFWQNANDPLQYTTKGKSHDHLPKKSNGLPAPLEQMTINTSCNPGRRLLRKGYYEAVGALMWLGEPFWKLAGADKTKVYGNHWFQASHPLPTVMRIEATPLCFTTDEDTIGELQHRLRSLLFPESSDAAPREGKQG